MLARLAGAPPPGPEARTAPKPPHRGGRAAPEHRRRTERGEGAKQGPPQAACLGLALREGCPALRLAAGKRRRRADLSRRRRCGAAAAARRLGGGDQPPHYPDCRRQAGRAAAPPPRRVGRGTARRPRGRVGRALLKGARTGAPFPCPVTVSRDKREKGAPQALPCLLNRGNPAWLSKVGGLPLPPPGKVHIIESPAPVGKPTKGFQPFTRQGPWALDPSPGPVPGFAWIRTGAPTHSLAKGLVCYTLQAAGLKV